MLGLQRWMRHRAWPYTRYSLVYRIRFKNNLIHLSCQRREKKKSRLAQKSCKMLSRRWFWKDLKDDFSNESTFRMRWPKYWMAGWRHRLDAHEFGWTLGAGMDREGWCAQRVWQDWAIELNWTELNWRITCSQEDGLQGVGGAQQRHKCGRLVLSYCWCEGHVLIQSIEQVFEC